MLVLVLVPPHPPPYTHTQAHAHGDLSLFVRVRTRRLTFETHDQIEMRLVRTNKAQYWSAGKWVTEARAHTHT